MRSEKVYKRGQKGVSWVGRLMTWQPKIVNYRVNNVIQSGLFNKWKQVYWSQQFSKIKIQVKNELSQDHLTLRHISLAFYILLCFLPFSIPILLFEILIF